MFQNNVSELEIYGELIFDGRFFIACSLFTLRAGGNFVLAHISSKLVGAHAFKIAVAVADARPAVKTSRTMGDFTMRSFFANQNQNI